MGKHMNRFGAVALMLALVTHVFLVGFSQESDGAWYGALAMAIILVLLAGWFLMQLWREKYVIGFMDRSKQGRAKFRPINLESLQFRDPQ